MTVDELIEELRSNGNAGDNVYVELPGRSLHAVTGVEIEGDLEGHAWIAIQVATHSLADGVTP